MYSFDLKGAAETEDLNSTSFMLISKKLGRFKLGSGAAIYYINRKIRAFPLLVFNYSSKRLNVEFAPPLSIKTDYKLNKKSTLGFEADLILTGFTVDYSTLNQSNLTQPDFINSDGFDIAFNFDRRFYETLHYKISTGFRYQEISYIENGIVVDELTLNDGLFLEISFYSTF